MLGRARNKVRYDQIYYAIRILAYIPTQRLLHVQKKSHVRLNDSVCACVRACLSIFVWSNPRWTTLPTFVRRYILRVHAHALYLPVIRLVLFAKAVIFAQPGGFTVLSNRLCVETAA